LRADGKWELTVTYNPGSDRTRMVDIVDTLDGNQTLFSRDIYYKNGRVVHGEGKVVRAETIQEGPSWTVTEYNATEYTGKVEVLKDGRLKVYVKDGFQIWERSGTGWRLTQHNRLEVDSKGNRSWIEETWSLDGKTYTKDVWTKENHGAEGKYHLYQVVVKDGMMTVTHYRPVGIDVWWGNSYDRTHGNDTGVSFASWTYTLDANGQPGELVEFNAQEGNFTAAWKRGRDPINRIPKYEKYQDRKSFGHLNVRGQTIDVPPGFKKTIKEEGGKYIETYESESNIAPPGGPKLVRFVYSNRNKTELVEQTYGEVQGGKYIETTTNPKDKAYSRIETYDPVGGNLTGNLISRVTTRTVDGRQVTFTGSLQGGKYIETATDYLNFKSVTVEYDHAFGHPVRRYGTLTDGRWAVDTFDASGNQVVKREIFDKEGGTLKEIWAGTDSDLRITRLNPNDEIKDEEFHYARRVPGAKEDSGSLELVDYSAHYTKTKEIVFTTGSKEGVDKDVTIACTEYHWKYFKTRDRDGTEDDHYREGSTVAKYNTTSSSPGRKVDPNPLWNKV
jgi:hypothetical protein